ncbi:MAG: hypothetical protein QM704_04210 [Anaeromyxobacteraceae bacterium]
MTGDSDGREFLASCEESLATEPQRARAMEAWAAAGKDAVLFEVTNSGFPEYEFAVVDDGGAKVGDASGRVRVVVTEDARPRALLAGLEVEGPLVRGDASFPAWDGDCYFLIVRRGARERRLAVYEKATGPVQVLLERLQRVMDAAQARAGEAGGQ